MTRPDNAGAVGGGWKGKQEGGDVDGEQMSQVPNVEPKLPKNASNAAPSTVL